MQFLPKDIHCEIVRHIVSAPEMRNIAQSSKYWRSICLLNSTYREFVVFFRKYVYIKYPILDIMNGAIRKEKLEIIKYIYKLHFTKFITNLNLYYMPVISSNNPILIRWFLEQHFVIGGFDEAICDINYLSIDTLKLIFPQILQNTINLREHAHLPHILVRILSQTIRTCNKEKIVYIINCIDEFVNEANQKIIEGIRIGHIMYETALTKLCKSGSFELVKYIFNKYPVYIYNKDSIFHATCSSGNLELVKWIYNKLQRFNYIAKFYDTTIKKFTPEISAWLDTLYTQYYLPLI